MGKYAGTPGKGPEGMTCKDCNYLVRNQLHGIRAKAANYCRLIASGDRENLWTGTKACEHFEPNPGLRGVKP